MKWWRELSTTYGVEWQSLAQDFEWWSQAQQLWLESVNFLFVTNARRPRSRGGGEALQDLMLVTFDRGLYSSVSVQLCGL